MSEEEAEKRDDEEVENDGEDGDDANRDDDKEETERQEEDEESEERKDEESEKDGEDIQQGICDDEEEAEKGEDAEVEAEEREDEKREDEESEDNIKDLLKVRQYLPLLVNLVHYDDKLKQVSNLKIRWSSGLVSQTLIQRTCPKLFQIDNIMFELGMVIFLYAVKLRERAMELVSTDYKKSVAVYREASGVFHHLSHELLPSLKTLVPPGKLPELTPPLCSCLSLLCLAEGQAVTTKNAEESGMSAILLSKLHYGISQLLSEASALLSSRANGEYKDLSTRFIEYVSTMGALHELKSQKHLAEMLESEDRVGEAVGVLRRALAAAKKSAPSKDDTWISILKTEREEVAKNMAKYERLNDSMMLQKIPIDREIPYPEGKKIVELIPYTPTRLERELRFKS